MSSAAMSHEPAGAVTRGANNAHGGSDSRGAGDNSGAGDRPLRRDAERNRLRVLTAAREVFAERGLVATLDDVARRAGVGVGTVYRRFADKEALVDALFEQSIDDMVSLAGRCLDEPDSWAGLARFVEGMCTMNASDRGLQTVLLGDSYGRGRVACAKDRLAPAAQRLVARAQADGRLRPDLFATDLPLITFALGSVVEYAGRTRPDVWRRILTIMLDGLRADAPARTPMPVPPLSEGDLTCVMSSWPRRND